MGFEWAYRSGRPAWDIEGPQPAIVEAARDGAIRGDVLDAGCGTGENALYLAERGLRVTGLDAAPTAVERAREKARERGLAVDVRVGDALALREALGLSEPAFDTVIDCGLFHVFSDPDRVRYEQGLRGVLRPGGTYVLLCFSDEQPGPTGPRRVSQAEIRASFADGWRVESIVGTRFATHDQDGSARSPRAWLATLTRLEDANGAPEAGS